jgi:hypothetical protein
MLGVLFRTSGTVCVKDWIEVDTQDLLLHKMYRHAHQSQNVACCALWRTIPRLVVTVMHAMRGRESSGQLLRGSLASLVKRTAAAESKQTNNAVQSLHALVNDPGCAIELVSRRQ